MTMSIALRREMRTVPTLIVSAQDHADLDDPVCPQHWRAATFVIRTDGGDTFTCDRCLGDTMRVALRSRSFTPSEVSSLNRAGSVAA